jgi:hypothetical protein
MLIRLILLAAVVATLIFFVRSQHGQRLRAHKRIAFFAFLALNAYAVLRPEDVMWVAVQLGVGRGADLVLYLLVVCFIFTTLNLYLRQRELEQRLTDVTRALALRDAERDEIAEAERASEDVPAIPPQTRAWHIAEAADPHGLPSAS